VVTLAGIGYYGQDLDIGDFGRKSATMAGIGPTMGMKHLLAFFFFFNKSGWYLLVEETMVVWHIILTKRETHVGVGRKIARAQDEKMWKDEKTQEKKNSHNEYLWAF